MASTDPVASGTVIPLNPSNEGDGGLTIHSTSPAVPTGRPTGNGGDGGVNRPIQSSAALYLYTFLATLVLLLAVSAAIVTRSFILRRRHRRLVEEAIRNGTWVPPAPATTGRTPRVDLSKKPVLWEAYLGGDDYGGFYAPGLHQEDVKDWDTIKPVSAAYLAPTPPPDASGTAKSAAGATDSPATSSSRAALSSGVRAIPSLAVSGLRWLVGMPPRNDAADTSSTQNGGSGGTGDGSATGQGSGENPPKGGPDGGPPVVRVSVIIAMPQPPKPTPPSAPIANSSSTPLSTLSPADSHPLTHHAGQLRPPDWDDEEPLPVMEMGVAELVVVDHERRDNASEMDAKAPLGRDSASMTVEV